MRRCNSLVRCSPERRYFAEYLTGLLVAPRKTVSGIENLQHIHHHDRGYVADLKSNRKVEYMGQTRRADEVAALIGPERRKPVEIDGEVQWHFTRSIGIPKMDHRVRLLILWKKKDDAQAWSPRRPGEQSHALGCGSHAEGVSSPLARHGVLPPGRQATFGHG